MPFAGSRMRPETVALMAQNQVGELASGAWRTVMPELTNDLDLFPGIPCRWGLGYMINLAPGPHGRSAGSLSWAGLFNTEFWVDPVKHVGGVHMMQLLPFYDDGAIRALRGFEETVYRELK